MGLCIKPPLGVEIECTAANRAGSFIRYPLGVENLFIGEDTLDIEDRGAYEVRSSCESNTIDDVLRELDESQATLRSILSNNMDMPVYLNFNTVDSMIATGVPLGLHVHLSRSPYCQLFQQAGIDPEHSIMRLIWILQQRMITYVSQHCYSGRNNLILQRDLESSDLEEVYNLESKQKFRRTHVCSRVKHQTIEYMLPDSTNEHDAIVTIVEDLVREANEAALYIVDTPSQSIPTLPIRAAIWRDEIIPAFRNGLASTEATPPELAEAAA